MISTSFVEPAPFPDIKTLLLHCPVGVGVIVGVVVGVGVIVGGNVTVGVGVVVKVGVPKTRAVEKVLLVTFAWVVNFAKTPDVRMRHNPAAMAKMSKSLFVIIIPMCGTDLWLLTFL